MNSLNIIGTQYDINKNALEIYVSGCLGHPHCRGCFSPETWEFNQGTHYLDSWNQIEEQIIQFHSMIDKVMIFGGEPLDQNMDDLVDLLQRLNKLKVEVWLFTHYIYDVAEHILGEHIKLCDYIKCGAYMPELTTDNNIQYGVKLATSNQKIYKIK